MKFKIGSFVEFKLNDTIMHGVITQIGYDLLFVDINNKRRIVVKQNECVII